MKRGGDRVDALIGRGDELAAIDDLLARLEEGPRALFVEGEAGIGKTRLWREGVERACERGFRVLSTRPGGTEIKLAFSALTDLIGDALGDVSPGLPPPQRRALEVALMLEDAGRAPPDQRAVSAAFLGVLRALAVERPLLIAIDDLQWLDTASASVVAFAVRRLVLEPVGVFATVRIGPVEAEPTELAEAIGEPLTRLPLGPLSVAAVYELVRSRLDFPLRRPLLLRVHETSGGRPFLALELARALRDANRNVEPDEPLPVPHGLRDLVLARLARLPESTQETLLAAASLSEPTLELLERAMPERATEDLRAAIEAGIVELDGHRIRFTHPLLASFHYASAPPSRHRAIHIRLAGIVTEPEERARHLALGADGPDETAASELAAAAERARSRGAIVASAELAELALELTPAKHDEQWHARLLVAADQHYAAGNTIRALTLLEEELVRAPAGPKRAELLWRLGRIRFEGEDPQGGLLFFHRSLEEARDDELLRARILESMTFPVAKQTGFQAAQACAREAAALAERLGDTPTLVRALAMLGFLKSMCGEGVATELFERATTFEEPPGRLELDYGPTFLYAQTLLDAGEFGRARPLIERLCEQGRMTGDAAVNVPLWLQAELEFETGDWDRAAELAKESYDLAVQTGREAAEPRGLFQLAKIEAARGELGSTARVEQALVLTDGRGWSSDGPPGPFGFLELSLENYQAAYDAFVPAIARYRSLGSPLIDQTFDAAEALAGLGRVEDGRALLDSGAKAAGRMRSSWAIAAATRAHGLLAASEGDIEAALTALEESVEVGERVGSPFRLARSLLALGVVQRRAQRKAAARQTLTRALDMFETLGARIWAERARRELGRIGGRTVPSGELSETEAQIAELVVAGRSNKEVAQALHLSPKTVEWNLSKIYRKLGVHSRTELAAARSAKG